MVNQVRIIAGRLRGRLIPFKPHQGLRPTPDRVRETLFNWLQMSISDARCLDCCAGSGALGFEAASRGAESVLMCDSDRRVVEQLASVSEQLQLDNIHVQRCELPNDRVISQAPFDLVFLDPPFRRGLVKLIANWLEQKQLLAEHALIYTESETELSDLQQPSHWTLKKEKQSGQVAYRLWQR